MLLVVLLAYVFFSLISWYFQTVSYGVVGMGDDKHDVRYALGSEHGGAETAQIWTYPTEANSTIRVEFTPSGQLDRISCSSAAAEPDSCPELYGIGIGETEDVIGGHLGAPSYIHISGDKKFIAYNSIGATYVLQQFVVTGLIRDPGRDRFVGKSWKFLRSLVYLPGAIG